jgi:hypothetical protein
MEASIAQHGIDDDFPLTGPRLGGDTSRNADRRRQPPNDKNAGQQQFRLLLGLLVRPRRRLRRTGRLATATPVTRRRLVDLRGCGTDDRSNSAAQRDRRRHGHDDG